MNELMIYIAIFATVFGIGAFAGATWMRHRKSAAITDSQGWWML